MLQRVVWLGYLYISSTITVAWIRDLKKTINVLLCCYRLLIWTQCDWTSTRDVSWCNFYDKCCNVSVMIKCLFVWSRPWWFIFPLYAINGYYVRNASTLIKLHLRLFKCFPRISMYLCNMICTSGFATTHVECLWCATTILQWI